MKMWSRSGMLRSVLSENAYPVYGICWNSDDSCIAFCCGENCFIKVLKSQVIKNFPVSEIKICHINEFAFKKNIYGSVISYWVYKWNS